MLGVRNLIAFSILAVVPATAALGQTGLSFDGTTSQHVTMGAAPGLNAAAFTVECWFTRTATGVVGSTGSAGITTMIPLVAKGAPQSDGSNVDANYIVGLSTTGNVIAADFEQFGVATGTLQNAPGLNRPVCGSTPISLNTWYHLAAVYDGCWHLYLNGVEETLTNACATSTVDWGTCPKHSSTPAGTDDAVMSMPRSDSIQHFAIGKMLTSAPAVTAGTFVGVIDEVRVWNLGRSQVQIQSAMFQELISGTGLIGRWGFNEGSGTVVDDAGGATGEFGTFMGTPTPSWVSGAPAITAPSPAQSALFFDGNNDHVTMGQALGLGAATFTVEFWMQWSGNGTTTTTGTGGVTTAIPMVTKGRGEAEGSNVDMNYFVGLSSGILAADFEDNTTGLNHPVCGSTTISPNVWHHVAATYDGACWQLYLDGVAETVSTSCSTCSGGACTTCPGATPRSDSVQHFALGTAMTSTGAAEGRFRGLLDEVRVWNVARSAAEISANKDQAISSGLGLIGRWGLNEATGMSAADSAGVTFENGTLVNNTTTENGPIWTDGPALSAGNLPPIAPTLVGPANGVAGVTDPATLEVTVSDPEAGNLDVTFFGRGLTQTVQDDFTVIVMPDTQFYACNNGPGCPASDAAIFGDQTQWIADSKASRNIVYVTQVGDCVQNGDNGGNNSEWLIADAAFQIIEDPIATMLVDGIPYGISVGNHDQSPIGSPTGTTTFYNQFFGESRFMGRGYYGGHYGANNDNHVDFFSASGMNFMVIHFEYDQADNATRQAVIAWADTLMTTHSSHRVILSAHYFMDAGNQGSFSNQGQAVYNALRHHSNLFLMVCGHVHQEGHRVDTFNGNNVHTLLSDYQGRTNGGDGWLRIMTFSPSNDEIHVETYSPWLDQFETDADSDFTISYDMGGGPGPFMSIGTDNGVPDNNNASVMWSGLSPNTLHEWYAEASDGNTSTAGPIWTFTSACTLDAQCDDSNVCTTDSCHLGTGICQHASTGGACDDGNLCTTGDVCSAGSCSGTPVSCLPGESCNALNGTCEVPAVMVMFQDGSGGYNSTQDTEIFESSTTADRGAEEEFGWDNDSSVFTDGLRIALLRFDQLFDTQGGPIPAGSQIASAQLQLVIHDSGDAGSLHDVAVAWSESTNYSNFGGDSGVQADEYDPSVRATLPTSSSTHLVNVTASVQNWSNNPSVNRGWILLPPTNVALNDGVRARSSEYTGELTERPKLIVNYLPDLCGDGITQSSEDCDDGNGSNTDACLNSCVLATCGDGFVRAGFESCDSAGESVSCNVDCTVAVCGDGKINATRGEQCDDGNAANTDACVGNCVFAVCGDGFIRAGVEACDDGNASNSDACLGSCVVATCGDGFLRAGVETCDDGNVLAGDGCDASCLIEPCVPTERAGNPGFENAVAPWQKATQGGRSIVTTIAHSGTHSLQMIVSSSFNRLVYQDIPVTAGVTYIISGWMNTTGVGGGGAQMNARWLDQAGLPENFTTHALRNDVIGTQAGTVGWMKHMSSLAAPANSVVVRIELFTPVDPDNAGTARFDDISVTDPTNGCNDGVFCNGVESCNPGGGCFAGTSPCDDGNACNGIESCHMVNGCQNGTALVCDDGNVCNGLESCHPVNGCEDGTLLVCDDNDACNGVEACDPMAGCVNGPAPDCDDDNFCTDDNCDAGLGCMHTAVPGCEFDVTVVPVARLVDPETTADNLMGGPPMSVSSLPGNTTFWLEIWAIDSGTLNSGLTSVYVDVGSCPGAIPLAVEHGNRFNTLVSGHISAGGVDEFGGSALPSGGGLEPEWVRVGWITMHADANVASCTVMLAPSSSGIGALGRGLVPWGSIDLGSATFSTDDGAGTPDYDLDGDGFIGAGDLALFAASWMQSVPPAASAHDFDCDGFVGPGDLSWFATGWLKFVSDPTIQYAPCGAANLASVAGLLEVEYDLVITRSPGASDFGSPWPATRKSRREIDRTDRFFVEIWATVAGTGASGITSAYVDLQFDPAASVVSIDHGSTFTQFASGTVLPGIVNELGGSSLPHGGGAFPQKVRVAIVEMQAAPNAKVVSLSLQPSLSGTAAYGSGLVDPDQIHFDQATMRRGSGGGE